ncbi:DNA ligase IV [Tieghemostelium lacteum]|uniref:DNA ligase n=1 Tax=Tieghemostelium lacteum TaxID=361077 RepID=A0A152A8P6_TIELA|nr:DNA ligase IV [Tieghemostelium lacteum]|eukprot:KYR02618.1 DNA ligase IV [Tieghemostelium lacteum]
MNKYTLSLHYSDNEDEIENDNIQKYINNTDKNFDMDIDESHDDTIQQSTSKSTTNSNNLDCNNNNKNNNNYDYQKTIAFSVFCELLDKLTLDSKHSKKKQHLSVFFNHYSKDASYYPLLRLLLPQLDKERQTYGLKEKTLAKFYVEMLNISPNSIDGQRLLNWKKPIGLHEMGGDFGSAVYLSLKNRCIQKSKLSMGDINHSLDSINKYQEKKDKIRVLKSILFNSTATEQKWYTRIILKELKTGLSEKSILNFYHPEAMEIYYMCSDLRLLCERLGNGQRTKLIQDPKIVMLFQPIRPMLANRQPLHVSQQLMDSTQFVVETKYDGERIQIHKDGDQIKMFSRNCNDSTYIYGDLFIPVIKECLLPDKCIIDGELIVWDSISQRFEDFGKLKTLALGAKDQPSDDTLGVNYGKQLCYMAFDVLYVKDQSVMDLSLQQRALILQRCVKPKDKSFEISPQKPVNNSSDLINLLDQAIINREEGVMLKSLTSNYVPGERKDKWIKIKPEYLEGVGDDLDLVIIGGYYGSGVGRRGGTLSHFMLGVPYFEDGLDPDRKYPEFEDVDRIPFYSFCKVGSGYSDEELKSLQQLLEPHWQQFKGNQPLKQLHFVDSIKDRPDVWIHPRNSVVLQIKSSQLVPSDKYFCNYTLRFPRVVKIRTDLNWLDCMDYHSMIKYSQEFEGRYAKRKLELLENQKELAEQKKKKKGNSNTTEKKSKKATLLSIFQDTDTSTILPVQSIFKGMEFCVLNGGKGEYSKMRLEIMIVENGGSKVQYPGEKTTYVLASKYDAVKIQNLVNHGSIDILHYQWLVDCIQETRLIPLGPKYMIYATEQTKTMFLKDSDIYGDSFTMPCTVQSLFDSFDQIQKQNNPLDRIINYDKVSMDQKYFKSNGWWSLFRCCHFYLDRYQVIGQTSTVTQNNRFNLTEMYLKFYGGNIQSTLDSQLTHIIIDETDLSRLNFISNKIEKYSTECNIKITTIDWVRECIDKKELVPINNIYNSMS